MDNLKNGAYDAVPTKENNEKPLYKKPKGFGARHLQALLMFLCTSAGYTIRSHLSVTMVAMTTPPEACQQSTLSEQNATFDVGINGSDFVNRSSDNLCGFDGDGDSWSVFQTYTWNKSTQEMMMFSFFLGYTTMMIPAGMLAQRYGAKKPILVTMFVNGIVSIITPWMPVVLGWLGVCICRFLQGLTQAALYPCVHTMLGRWAPLSERGRLSSLIYAGSQIGTILAFQVSGFFGGSVFGWPSSFWCSGILCLVCFGIVLWLGAATPHDHPTISDEELMFITGRDAGEAVPKQRSTPWKEIMTSTAVMAIVVTHIGSAMGFLFVLTQTPRYINNVLHVDIKHNGVYSSLPYIAMVFMTLLFGWLSDFFKTKGYLSIRNIRKIFNSIGLVGPGIFLLWFAYVDNVLLAVVLLVVSQALHSGVHLGFHINQIDLCPNFSGPVFALGNMVSGLTALLVPVIVSYIVKDDVGNQQRWQTVFWIMSAVMVVSNMFFVVFAKGELQPWNDIDTEKKNAAEEIYLTEKNKEKV